MTTLSDLHTQRCYGSKPHFWNPQPITYTPHTLYGDDNSPCGVDWGVTETVKKILALGLELELPVGQWVSEARVSELGGREDYRVILQANIADEAAHDKGFRYAAEVYEIPSEIRDEARMVKATWMAAEGSPLEKAALSETGVFLVTLGLLRLFGGRSLASMAARVNDDEFRHVATNRFLLGEVGIDATKPSSSIDKIRINTIDWVISNLKLPKEALGLHLSKDFLIEQSNSLVSTGGARDFDDLVYLADFPLPFELPNSSEELYGRALEIN